jgi:hypothetical protein
MKPPTEQRQHARLKAKNLLSDEFLNYADFSAFFGKFHVKQYLYPSDPTRKISRDNYVFGDRKTAMRYTGNNSQFYTFNGETKCMAEWAEDLGLTKQALHQRLKSGWTVAQALSTPKAGWSE